MKDYLIQRHIPGAHLLSPEQRTAAAAHSNAVLADLGPGIKWVDSHIVTDGTFCHYRAENEDIIREHARLSGFPANTITEIAGGLSPASAAG